MKFLAQCDTTSGCGHIFPGDLHECPKCGAPEHFSDDVSNTLNPLHYIYDEETYPNVFTCAFIHPATGMKWKFEISNYVNQLEQFVAFVHCLRDQGATMVGYNNVGFDYPVMHFILTNPYVSAEQIYNKAMHIISGADRFGNIIWDNDQIVPQLDLFKIHHFDNINKSVSLKSLEISMQMKNIEDLPFPVGTVLGREQIKVLHTYNMHDVVATTLFYVRTLGQIELRRTLSEKYKVNMTNFSNTKIGGTILITELEQAGVECYEKIAGKRQPRQTIRPVINLGEVIFDYVKFDNPAFEIVRSYIANKTITETKGVMGNVDVTDWPPELLAPQEFWTPTFKIMKKGGRLIASNLHVMIDGCPYVFGVGGLHMSVLPTIIRSNETHQIIDVDVTSFYPKLAIENDLYPAHLGNQYGVTYESIFVQRASHAKGTDENAALKEALNASYGNSNNLFSPLYDPFYTMQTTINGQLLLCMLVEQLVKIPDLSMIQCNTDGVTYSCPREYISHTRVLCKWWEDLTRLNLEEALYSRMMIRDVNNYTAEYEDGSVKLKGAYGHSPQWHQDPSSQVVAKAAEAFLVNGQCVEDFIRNHKDKFDFMCRAKVPRSNQLTMRWTMDDCNIDIQLATIIRYFVSVDGGSLVKIAPPTGKAGTWKRKTRVPDVEYNAVMNELQSQMDVADGAGFSDGRVHYVPDTMSDYPAGHDDRSVAVKNYKESWYVIVDGVRVVTDTDGTPHDERIHTKNKSKHDIREMSICSGWLTTDCSDADRFDWSAINYDWYIQQANKLVEPLL